MLTPNSFILLITVGVCAAVIIGSFIYFLMIMASNMELDFYPGIFSQTVFWSGVIIFGMTLLAASPFGDDVAKLYFPIRKQSFREEQQLAPIMEQIHQDYRQKYGEDIKVNVSVLDLPHINGLALGKETVAVSTGLLKTGTDEEITAVLAHEVGHLHNGDGVFNMALATASFPIMLGCKIFGGIVLLMPKPKLSDIGKNDDIFSMCIFMARTGIVVFCGMFLWASLPAIWMMKAFKFCTEWPVEYRADKFAGDLGHAPALVSLFERIEDEDVRGESGFLRKYIYSHPPTALRIDRLERAMGA